MKKSILFIFAVCFTVFFSACHKEKANVNNGEASAYNGSLEGVYNPEKKISRVYVTNENSSTNPGVRQLYEVWTWNTNNTLDKIDKYNIYGTNHEIIISEQFTYDDKQRIKTFTLKEWSSSIGDFKVCWYDQYLYSGNYLTEIIESMNEDSNPCRTYRITHENGKISKITVEGELSKGLKNANPLQYILSEEIGKDTNKNIGRKLAINGETVMGTITEFFTWENDNNTKIDRTVTYQGDNGETVSGTNTYIYQYDNYRNPFYGFIAVDFPTSKNNIIREERLGVDVYTYTYTYTYEGNYPVSKTESYNGYPQRVYEYEYLN